MDIIWRRNDGFDQLGRRVVTVLRAKDMLGSGDIYLADTYWVAFVFHEYVLVDGEPGRWKTADEAKAAAQIAYVAALRGGRSLPEPEPASEPRRRGWFVRNFVSTSFPRLARRRRR